MQDEIGGEARESRRLGAERKNAKVPRAYAVGTPPFRRASDDPRQAPSAAPSSCNRRCQRLAYPSTSLFPSSSPALRRCPSGCLRQAASLRSARIESTKAGVLAQRVVGHERVKRSSLPDNLLARGGENLGERGGFFIVQVDPALGMSMGASRVPA
jgi:hypothetical protein